MKVYCPQLCGNLICTVAIICLSLVLFGTSSAGADDHGKKLVTAGPSWEGFTNPDGSGLYHEIIENIFDDYSVIHLYVPTVQALSMVAIGRADLKMCETEEKAPLMMASYPMYENNFYVVYLRSTIDSWKGAESLEGKKLVWRKGYYSPADFAVPVQAVDVRSGESALKMVIHGRADFYVDDLRLIEQSFETADEYFDSEKYGIKRIGARKYYPVFARTARGEKLRHIFETGIMRLYREGVLQEIYRRWDFPLPSFSFAADGD